MPTFQNQRRGSRSPGIVAIPGRRFGAARPNFAGALTVGSKSFRSQSFSTHNAAIAGITKDSAGAPLAACTVQLFRTSDDLLLTEVISDGVGAYVLYPAVTGPFYIIAYKAGSPDLAGTTVNTIVGV